RRDIAAHVLGELLATPAVAHGDGDGALGVGLADDVLVELGDDLFGGQLIHSALILRSIARQRPPRRPGGRRRAFAPSRSTPWRRPPDQTIARHDRSAAGSCISADHRWRRGGRRRLARTSRGTVSAGLRRSLRTAFVAGGASGPCRYRR